MHKPVDAPCTLSRLFKVYSRPEWISKQEIHERRNMPGNAKEDISMQARKSVLWNKKEIQMNIQRKEAIPCAGEPDRHGIPDSIPGRARRLSGATPSHKGDGKLPCQNKRKC